MKRFTKYPRSYVKASFEDDRSDVNYDLDLVKSIIEEALAPYRIECVSCKVGYKSIFGFVVKYNGQTIDAWRESTLNYPERITSVEDYKATQSFQGILYEVFSKVFREDARLVEQVQQVITDAANSFTDSSNNNVECDFVGGYVFGSAPAHLPSGRYREASIEFFPKTWAYYTAEGLVNGNKYRTVDKGNVTIDIPIEDIYSILTSGVDSVDIEGIVDEQLEDLGLRYKANVLDVAEKDKQNSIIDANIDRLAEYLQYQLPSYHINIDRNSGYYIPINYTVNNQAGRYVPQIGRPNLYDIDNNLMKKIYTGLRKAINRTKNKVDVADQDYIRPW